MFAIARRRLVTSMSTSSLSSSIYEGRRSITFTAGTERLKTIDDPTIQTNIKEIDAADKRDKRETVVLKGGTFSHYKPADRHVFLPLGDDDPVGASHELQHARDFVKLDALPDNHVLERRAFAAQQKTAKHLNLDDQLGGKTPDQRAATHSQVII